VQRDVTDVYVSIRILRRISTTFNANNAVFNVV